MIAITHIPSPRLLECELTHVVRTPIDYDCVQRQHTAYRQMLEACGAEVWLLEVNRDLPDCVFVEDTAIVLDEVAVLCSMGTASRRNEPAGIEQELQRFRKVLRIELPASIEGGDVLRVGRKLLVGQSSRTDAAGAAALADVVVRYGYSVTPVPVRECLHLKTACTALPDNTLLVNSAWLDMTALAGFNLVAVPEMEPWGANILLAGERVCAASANSRTADLIRRRGFEVRTVDISEFAKAEGGMTCLSILFN